MRDFTSIDYFLNLAGLTLVLLPLVFLPLGPTTKRILFSLTGAYLLFFIAPRLLLFYLIFWLLIALLQWLVAALAEGRWGTVVLWGATITTLAPMIYWKLNYEEVNFQFNVIGNLLTGKISPWLQEIDFVANIVIPIGLSFATFRAVDLLIKTWLGKFGALSLDRLFFYGFFPPVQAIGPIIQYEEIQQQGEKFSRPEPADILMGCLRIAAGGLKIVLVGVVFTPAGSILLSYRDESTLVVWSWLFFYTWYFYLNFSAFSDIAIGFARLFGFVLKENFSYPFFQKNIADFWNSWHMSLSHFAQRNVYVPMGGYRKKTQYVAIFFTIMVIALWHDLTLGMVLFGVYHGLGLVAHRIWVDWRGPGRSSGPVSVVSRILVTYVFVSCSFPLLVLPLDEAVSFYQSLAGVL
jgi:alginate O-acetyltransferase complex protein AlgI